MCSKLVLHLSVYDFKKIHAPRSSKANFSFLARRGRINAGFFQMGNFFNKDAAN